VLTLTKVAETSSTITLGWTPPVGVGGYVFYADGQAVSVGSKNMKDGTPRKEIKFSKTSPGPPFHVTAVVRSSGGAYSLEVGAWADAPPLPSNVAESAPTALVAA
jgi:hypothetical protein